MSQREEAWGDKGWSVGAEERWSVGGEEGWVYSDYLVTNGLSWEI